MPSWKQALLVLLLALVAIVTIHPHFNVLTQVSDPFPVHADEYVHWGYAQAIADQGTLSFSDPFSGGATSAVETSIDSHEIGYQGYLAVLQQATSIPWPTFLTLFPTIVALLTASALFVLGERWGAGLFTVLWFAAVPTSLRFLGPAFAVPVAFSLPLLATGLFLLFSTRSPGAIALLLVLVSALWFIHAAGALLLTAAIVIYGLVSLRVTPGRAAALIVVAAVPLLLGHGALESFASDISYTPTLPLGLASFRLPTVVFYISAAVGASGLVLARDPRTRRAGLVLGIILLLLLGLMARRATTGVDAFRAFDRATLAAAFLAAILAGAATASLVRWTLRGSAQRSWRPLGVAAAFLLVVLQVATVGQAALAQLEQPYYVSMTQAQYDAYREAADKLGPDYSRALVGGGPTMPFTVVTGRPTLFVRTPELDLEPPYVQQFFREGARDTRLLVETQTTIVVAQGAVTNPDLREVAPGVYALREDYVERLGTSTARTP